MIQKTQSNCTSYNNNIYPTLISSNSGGSIQDNSIIFKHAYEKGILDYMNGCVDPKIISIERLRALKLDKL